MKFQKYNYFSNALNKTYKVTFEVYKGCEENNCWNIIKL